MFSAFLWTSVPRIYWGTQSHHLYTTRRTHNLTSSSYPGAEGMQEADHVSVLHGTDPWGLHHQPHVQLGGPSGTECLCATWWYGGQPETRAWHGGEDGKPAGCERECFPAFWKWPRSNSKLLSRIIQFFIFLQMSSHLCLTAVSIGQKYVSLRTSWPLVLWNFGRQTYNKVV